MKDASYSLRVAYIKSLEGIFFKDGEVFSYDEIADQEEKNYIVVSGQSSSETSFKCGFSGDYMITLNIVCKYPIGSGTKKDSEEISNMVLERVYPSISTTGVVISEDFDIWNTRLVTNRTIVDETGSERVITKVLTFQHSINQIN
ncbi:hypothetical protein ACFSQ3_01065 [Sphingobacterium corticis]|uniref:DUF3168 domain-containing protein n=1 Tax=Sphingobacterium corticis TaxID=1812823 RepID=A0ABW5NHL3_9SPHI